MVVCERLSLEVNREEEELIFVYPLALALNKCLKLSANGLPSL